MSSVAEPGAGTGCVKINLKNQYGDVTGAINIKTGLVTLLLFVWYE